MDSNLETLKILRRVRELLDSPQSWVKGVGRDLAGRMCMLGAVDAAVEERFGFSRWDGLAPPRDARVYELLAHVKSVLYKHIPSPFGVMMFNDDPRTTHADVLKVLDAAIEDASK